MQSIIIEKPYVFVPPKRSTFWSSLFRLVGVHTRKLASSEGVTSHEIRHVERLKASLAAGHGILIAPNHPRMADPLAMGWIGEAAGCHIYGMASWHLFQSAFNRFFLTGAGAFSIHREGVDRAAINFSIEVIENAERPLVVFAEGTTSRTNDRLGPMLDGMAFIVRAAAKKRNKQTPPKKVVVHPVALKYLFQGDFQTTIDATLQRIEKRLTWLPQNGMPLLDRIVKIGAGLLTLKEVEHLGQSQSGTFAERMARLVNHLLQPHEREFLGAEQSGSSVPRVRSLRVKILPDMVEGRVDAAERTRREKILADLYLAQQIEAYPPDYLADQPSWDRLLEIVEKYEEDLFDAIIPKPPVKAIIEIGEAIEVSPERDRKAPVDPLMAEIEAKLQAMLDRLAHESPAHSPVS